MTRCGWRSCAPIGGTRVTVSGPQGEDPKVYPGARAAALLLDAIVPVRAVRALGPQPPGKIDELGLARPATLTITMTSPPGERALAIGTNVFGSTDLYVRAPDGGVHVAAVAGLEDLRTPRETLVDMAALGVPRAQIERVVVQFEGERREWRQVQAGDPDRAHFRSGADPARPLPEVGPWVDRLLRLPVIDLVDNDIQGEPILTVRLEGQGRLLASLSLGAPVGATQVHPARASRFSRPVLLKPFALEALLHELQTLPP